VRKKIVIGLFIILAVLIMAGLAWAYSPTPICFYDVNNSCSVVSPTNPLPTVNM
jgi:hypothetical protein